MSPAAAKTGKLPYSHARRDTQDADDHAACLSNWQQRYDQLSAGSFAGLFEEFCFDKVQLFREGLNQSVHQTGGAWPGSRTFAVPVAIDGTGWFAGEVYGAHSMLTLGGPTSWTFAHLASSRSWPVRQMRRRSATTRNRSIIETSRPSSPGAGWRRRRPSGSRHSADCWPR